MSSRVKTIIFDLSEVLISGLCGVEQKLSLRLAQPPAEILSALGGDRLQQICQGKISEDVFLKLAISDHGWKITTNELKQAIRENFRCKVAGMEELLQQLAAHYDLILLSDHAKEWVQYIHELHPHLQIFRQRIYSFETGRTKREPAAFEQLLESIQRRNDECVFIDDSSLNVECARKAGIRAFHFTNAAALLDDLRSAAIIPCHPPN